MGPARRAAGASFGAARRLFLLVFRAGAFALSFPARQRISNRHSRHCTGARSEHQYILAADSHGIAGGEQSDATQAQADRAWPRKTPRRPVDRHTSSAPKRPSLEQMKGGEVSSADEAADQSVQNADNPLLAREDVQNTSNSSGLRADDQARGELIKGQLRTATLFRRPPTATRRQRGGSKRLPAWPRPRGLDGRP